MNLKINSILTLALSILLITGCASEQAIPNVPPSEDSKKVTPGTPPLDSGEINLDSSQLSNVPQLDMEKLSGTTPLCGDGLNTDEANEWVRYQNESPAFSVLLPYNSAWGNSDVKFDPYNENKDGSIDFGAPGAYGECSILRSYSMRIGPTRTFKEIKESLANLPDYNEYEPSQVNIDNMNVVQYEEFGVCPYPTIEVLGKESNILFIRHCPKSEFETGNSLDAEFDLLKEVAKTIDFSL